MAQTIRIKDADGNEVKLLANADGSYSLPVSGSVKAELLGSNVETNTIAGAVALTQASTTYTFTLPISTVQKYREIEIFVLSTLDISILVAFDNSYLYAFKTESGALIPYSAGTGFLAHTVPANTSVRTSLSSFPATVVGGSDKAIDPAPYKSILLRSGAGTGNAFAARVRVGPVAPTTGAFSMWLVGVK